VKSVNYIVLPFCVFSRDSSHFYILYVKLIYWPIESIWKWNWGSKKSIKWKGGDETITILSGNRFGDPEFPKVAWQLFIEIIHSSSDYGRGYSQSYNKGENDIIHIWLSQMGPNGLNDFVNTKYKIYAIVEDNTNVDIAK